MNLVEGLEVICKPGEYIGYAQPQRYGHYIDGNLGSFGQLLIQTIHLGDDMTFQKLLREHILLAVKLFQYYTERCIDILQYGKV